MCWVAVVYGYLARRDARRRLRAATHRVVTLANAHELANAFEEKPEEWQHGRLAHRQMAGLRAWCNMCHKGDT